MNSFKGIYGILGVIALTAYIAQDSLKVVKIPERQERHIPLQYTSLNQIYVLDTSFDKLDAEFNFETFASRLPGDKESFTPSEVRQAIFDFVYPFVVSTLTVSEFQGLI